MSALLSVTSTWNGPRYVVVATGEVDLFTCPILADALRGCLERPLEELELDLSSVSFVDSTGFACLVQWAEDCRARGGHLTVRRRANVQRAIEIMGWEIPEPAVTVRA
ncbi:MAG: hypothetical protein QOJ13_413 [Gaiellales bacterium]|jgi:anti-sigma B factor antagonist|nr:hypothetical protein [Gaiellales bacterium]